MTPSCRCFGAQYAPEFATDLHKFSLNGTG